MLITAIQALAIIASMQRPFAAPDGGAGAGGQDPAGTGDPSGTGNTPAGTDPQKNAESTLYIKVSLCGSYLFVGQ